MTAFTPRPYQVQAEKACYLAWEAGLLRIMVVLPTGMGKTVILSNMIAREIAVGHRVVIIVNRNALVGQTIDQVKRAAPSASIGIVKSTRNQVKAQVIIASVQSLGRSRLRRTAIGNVDLVIIDECHHSSANSYMASIRDLGGFKTTRVLGLTATAARNDELGLGDAWQDVVYKRDLEYAWANGYLIRPTIKRVHLTDRSPEVIADTWVGESEDRQGMVFTTTVARAKAIGRALDALKVPNAVIHANTPDEEREMAYKRARAYEIKVLVSVGTLTEGFDMPQLEVVLLDGGPGTQTSFVQKTGRILRPFTNEMTGYVKTRAILIDTSGASDKHSLTVEPDLSMSLKREPAKETPKDLVHYSIDIRKSFGVYNRVKVKRDKRVIRKFGVWGSPDHAVKVARAWVDAEHERHYSKRT